MEGGGGAAAARAAATALTAPTTRNGKLPAALGMRHSVHMLSKLQPFSLPAPSPPPLPPPQGFGCGAVEPYGIGKESTSPGFTSSLRKSKEKCEAVCQLDIQLQVMGSLQVGELGPERRGNVPPREYERHVLLLPFPKVCAANRRICREQCWLIQNPRPGRPTRLGVPLAILFWIFVIRS